MSDDDKVGFAWITGMILLAFGIGLLCSQFEMPLWKDIVVSISIALGLGLIAVIAAG